MTERCEWGCTHELCMSCVEQLLPSKRGECKYNCWCRIYRSHRACLSLHKHHTVTTCCIQSWIKLTLWLSGQRNSVTSRSNEYSDYKVESQFDWSRFSQHVSVCMLSHMFTQQDHATDTLAPHAHTTTSAQRPRFRPQHVRLMFKHNTLAYHDAVTNTTHDWIRLRLRRKLHAVCSCCFRL